MITSTEPETDTAMSQLTPMSRIITPAGTANILVVSSRPTLKHSHRAKESEHQLLLAPRYTDKENNGHDTAPWKMVAGTDSSSRPKSV